MYWAPTLGTLLEALTRNCLRSELTCFPNSNNSSRSISYSSILTCGLSLMYCLGQKMGAQSCCAFLDRSLGSPAATSNSVPISNVLRFWVSYSSTLTTRVHFSMILGLPLPRWLTVLMLCSSFSSGSAKSRMCSSSSMFGSELSASSDILLYLWLFAVEYRMLGKEIR